MLVRDLTTGRLVMLGGNAALPRLGAYAAPRGAGPPATAFYSPRLGYQSQWVRDERLGLPILAALPAIAAKVLPIVGSLLPMLTAKSESPPQTSQSSPGPTPQAQPADKPSLLTTATTLLPQVANALTSVMPMPRAQTAPPTGSPAEQTPTAPTQQLPGVQSMGPSQAPSESIPPPGSPPQAAPVAQTTQTTDTNTEVVVAPMRIRQPDGRVAVVPVRVRRRRKRRRRVRVVRASPAYARGPGMGYAVPPMGFLRPPPFY